MPDHPVPHPDVSGYVLGVLEPDESSDFAAHLRTCPPCQREVAELASLRVLLDQAMPVPTLPEGLAQRTFAAVAREATDLPTPLPPAPPRRRSGRPARLVPAVAAALGAVVVVAGLLVAAGRSNPGGREIELVAADGGATGAVARLHRAPLGMVVELHVDGLAVPPPGRFYECWYVGVDDAPDRPARLSAGTFTLPASGPATVRMTTAADPARYPRIEVTLEPDDGDPRSTGPVVLKSPPRRGRGSTD